MVEADGGKEEIEREEEEDGRYWQYPKNAGQCTPSFSPGEATRHHAHDIQNGDECSAVQYFVGRGALITILRRARRLCWDRMNVGTLRNLRDGGFEYQSRSTWHGYVDVESFATSRDAIGGRGLGRTRALGV